MRFENADDVTGTDWLGFDWSDWALLEPRTKRLLSIPPTPGFFRIKKIGDDTLDFVGHTGNLHDRLIHLANKVASDERPRYSQASAEHLWELKEAGGRFEVSTTNPNISRSEADRIGLENVMFAAHIRTRGRSPTVNLDRVMDHEESNLPDLDWDTDDMTAQDWMGLDWSDPLPLSERTSIDISHAVYRIWFPLFTPPLAYIGKSTNVANRLIKHEKKFGSDALFTVAHCPRHLKDVEAALIAEHYRRTHTLPKGQNGMRNRFVWPEN